MFLILFNSNLFQDIVPFDATRVALETAVCVDGDSEPSDFINASFISDISATHATSQVDGIALGNVQIIGNGNASSSSQQQPQTLRSKLNLSKYFPGLRSHPKVNPETAPTRQRLGLHNNGTVFSQEQVSLFGRHEISKNNWSKIPKLIF